MLVSEFFMDVPLPSNVNQLGKVNDTVHPHACGEHGSNTITPRPWLGSSPRLWGTQNKIEMEPYLSRFIPTPVGNTHNC